MSLLFLSSAFYSPLHHICSVCVTHVCMTHFLRIDSHHCCFLLLCPLVFIVSSVPAAARSWWHTSARLTDRFVVSSPISHSQIVYAALSDLVLILFILISPASFSVIHMLGNENTVKSKRGGCSMIESFTFFNFQSQD